MGLDLHFSPSNMDAFSSKGIERFALRASVSALPYISKVVWNYILYIIWRFPKNGVAQIILFPSSYWGTTIFLSNYPYVAINKTSVPPYIG
jgi:hypothetical protein